MAATGGALTTAWHWSLRHLSARSKVAMVEGTGQGLVIWGRGQLLVILQRQHTQVRLALTGVPPSSCSPGKSEPGQLSSLSPGGSWGLS